MGKKSKVATNIRPTFGLRGWILIITGMCGFYMGATAPNDSLNVTLPMFQSLYGWSDGTLSRIASYGGWIGAALTLPTAALMRRIGPRKIMILAELDLLVCVLLLGSVNNITCYMVLYTCICLGADALLLLAFGAITSHWFPAKKGLVMGYSTLGCNIGSCTIAWLLTGSWKLLGFNPLGFVPYAGIIAVALVLTVVFLRDYPEECGCYPDNNKDMTSEMAKEIYTAGLRYKDSSDWTIKRLLKTPQTWLIIFGLGFFQLSTMGIVSHIVPILINRGYSTNFAMMGMSVAGIVAMPCSVLLGMVDARMGTRRAALLLAGVSIIAFGLAAIPMKWSAAIAVLEGAIMMGCSNNLLVSMVTSVWGRYDYEKAISIILPLYMFCGSAGAGLVGTLSEAASISVVMIVLAGLSGISLILLNRLSDQCIGRKEFSEAAAGGTGCDVK